MEFVLLLLYIGLIVGPIGILVHELGHAIGAYIVEASKITIKIGSGRHFKTYKIGKIHFVIYSLYFLGGIAKSKREEQYSRIEKIWISICGPLSSGILASLFFFIAKIVPTIYLELLFYFNAWLTLVNMIPFRIKDKQSDGYIILQSIFVK